MRLISKLRKYWLLRTAKGYEKWLREQGVIIGRNLRLFNHKSIRIDVSSPGLISIGNDVHITAGVSILTHDGRFWFLKQVYRNIISSRAAVRIGNNVYIGQNAIILRGVTIGDNVIIGAGAIVTKDIPSDSIAVGVPARKIMTVDEFYQKSKDGFLGEAKQYARDLYRYRGVRPTIEDFWEEFALFYHEEENYPETFVQRIKNVQLPGSLYDEFIKNNKPTYASFEEFLNDALKDVEE